MGNGRINEAMKIGSCGWRGHDLQAWQFWVASCSTSLREVT
ncbi:MAG: hypothetical protein RLZZ282_1521 [Verrucomicrobiota bacterium]